MEVQIPPGREGIEHGSPTSWVTALITGLVDKKGMTAAAVNPTSYFLCGFVFFSITSAQNETFWLKQRIFFSAQFMGFVLFRQRKLENIISD